MGKDNCDMIKAVSPLRYPGGKSCLYDLASQILRLNKLELGHYAEPYAGGCGLALKLLYEGHVSDIHVNDLDVAIWSFWHSILNDTDRIVERIRQIPVTVGEWHTQREIHLQCDASDPLSLGFATFFLNRVNRSGIIKDAGVIGGLSQDGNYKIDCRFNKAGLIGRIRRLEKYKKRIHLHNMDALDFMGYCEKSLPLKTLICIDPPYFNKGSSLYTNFYQPSDHASVAKAVLKLNRPWVLTYDSVPEIQVLYKTKRQFIFDVNYTLQTKRVGTELLIVSKGLKLPEEVRSRQIDIRERKLALV
jgi:DNA adenine methylase